MRISRLLRLHFLLSGLLACFGGPAAGQSCLALNRSFGFESAPEIVSATDAIAQAFSKAAVDSGNAVHLSKILSLYEPQKTPNLCSVASGNIAIRVLRDPSFQSENFLNAATDAIEKSQLIQVDGNKVRDLPQGQSLAQLATMLEKVHDLRSQPNIVSGTPESIDQFRKNLLSSNSNPKTLMIVNYQESAISKEFPDGGHFSPVAAYDPISDRALIADVFQTDKSSKTDTSWFWVKTDRLIDAMNSLDSESKQNRGYILLEN